MSFLISYQVADELLRIRLQSLLNRVDRSLLELEAGDCEIILSDAPRTNANWPVTEGYVFRAWITFAEATDPLADLTLPQDFLDRELEHALAMLQRIFKLQAECAQQKIERQNYFNLAHRDPLTQLANRRGWDNHLNALVSQQSNCRCLVLIDVDYFKDVNDAFGHQQGDAVLMEIAQKLQGDIRLCDFAVRLGGDEFGLDLAEMTPATAQSVVERIRRDLTVQLPSGKVTVSAGYVVYDPAQHLIGVVTTTADVRLSHAKLAGRGQTLGAVLPMR